MLGIHFGDGNHHILGIHGGLALPHIHGHLESGNGTCEESESVSVHHHDLHPQSAWEIVTSTVFPHHHHVWEGNGSGHVESVLLTFRL